MSNEHSQIVFIADFKNQCIREKGSWDYHDQEEYEKHIANLRTYPYPVKEDQDGKELVEGIDFRIVSSAIPIKAFLKTPKERLPIDKAPEKDEGTKSWVINYLRGEYELQIEKMRKLGIPVEDQFFEQCVNSLIWLCEINGISWDKPKILSSPPDKEAAKNCICDNCAQPYFLDVSVSDEIWIKISPKKVDGWKSGGLLCPQCIVDRMQNLLTDKEGDADYWEKRCEAAERVIGFCDPDPLYLSKWNKGKFDIWQELKNQQP